MKWYLIVIFICNPFSEIKPFIYLFIYYHLKTFFIAFRERMEGREKGRERETWIWETNIDWSPPIHSKTRECRCLNWGSNLQPRCVPWLGIQPATSWLWDDTPANWATPASVSPFILCIDSYIVKVILYAHILEYFSTCNWNIIISPCYMLFINNF